MDRRHTFSKFLYDVQKVGSSQLDRFVVDDDWIQITGRYVHPIYAELIQPQTREPGLNFPPRFLCVRQEQDILSSPKFQLMR